MPFLKSIFKCLPSPLPFTGDTKSTRATPPVKPSTSSSDSEGVNLVAVEASGRFFFSPPGGSKSIIETRATLPLHCERVNGGVAVKKYSPDPHADFRSSMQEMIEAKRRTTGVDSRYLNDLLSCYFDLNPRATHKYILSAFAETIIGMVPVKASPEEHLAFACNNSLLNVTH